MTEVGCAISAVCLKEYGGGGAIAAGIPERDSGIGQRSERRAERPRKAPRFPGGPFGTAASSVEGRELIVGPGALVVGGRIDLCRSWKNDIESKTMGPRSRRVYSYRWVRAV